MTDSSATNNDLGPPASVFVGIDVAKATLDVVLRPSGEHMQVPNSVPGHQQLCQKLAGQPVVCIVLESTGGYERAVVTALVEEGLPVAVVNARRARDLAKGLGKLAKTDRIDAGVLAFFAEHCDLPKAGRVPERQVQLEALVVRRRQLVAMRAVEETRLKQNPHAKTQKDIEQTIAFLDRHVENIEKQINALIDSDDHWSSLAELLRSVPGVGAATAAVLLAELPELGRLNRRQIASLAGLAPFNRDSGKHRGKRRVTGGREALRTSLYMATIAARQWNAKIRDFHARLTAAGKPFKVALIASMRKLLTILNHIVKTKTKWNGPSLKNA